MLSLVEELGFIPHEIRKDLYFHCELKHDIVTRELPLDINLVIPIACSVPTWLCGTNIELHTSTSGP